MSEQIPEHAAKQIYKGKAALDFHKGESLTGFMADGFQVFVDGHVIAECEDSECADFICKAWNGESSAEAKVAELEAANERLDRMLSAYDETSTKQAFRIAAQDAALDKWREREAACCPEGYGFEEVIALQGKRIAEQAATIKALTNGGAGLIAAERSRQVESEGWSAAHDDEHFMGEMVGAAITYAAHSLGLVSDEEIPNADCIEFCPWDESWWKPSPDPIHNLVKAGALIAAEIDRLTRAALKQEPKP